MSVHRACPLCGPWRWLCCGIIVLAASASLRGDAQDRTQATVSEGAEAMTGRLTTTREVVNLLEYVPVADAHVDDGLVGAVDIEAARYFSGGWHHVQPSGSGDAYRWLGRQVGSIDISLATLGELVIRLELAPPQGDEVPAQQVRTFWNGHDLGVAVLERSAQVLELEVPPRFQRVGPNRLELMPAFWVDFSKLRPGVGTRDISLRLSSLEIVRPRDVGKRLPPETPIEEREGRLVQHPNSVLTFYTTLGRGPVLHVGGEIQSQDGVDLRSVDGRIRIALTSTRGESEILQLLLLRSLADLRSSVSIWISLRMRTTLPR